LISVFFVFSNLLFPFITSKQISFNILIEVLMIFWIALIVKYPEYRPKKSYISFGLLSFFLIMIISCFTGVDFNLSFWGDVERMLGVFHLLHFLGLYFIIITVMRDWEDWKWFFVFSVICATFVSFYGLANMAYSTIGNTAYVSGYLLFNMYFCLLLFFRERASDYRWLYLIPVFVMMLEFKKADTTGAYVGLLASIFVLFFLYILLGKNKKVKQVSASALLIFLFLVLMVFVNKDSKFVETNLSFVREINFQKNTFQTRLISWRAALKDFKVHPIIGTGHGNYAIIFDKYFEPTFYDYTRSETYFDRAHNNLIDILSTTGILGLISYLSIFFAIAYYLINAYRENKTDIHEFVILSSLLVAYFVQNLAVFDSLVTYISLMIVLAYVYWIYNKEGLKEQLEIKEAKFSDKEIYALVFSSALLLTVLFQYNYKPIKMLIGTIEGQKVWAQENDIEKTTEAYKKALSYKTVLDRDSRTTYVRLFTSASVFGDLNPEKKLEIMNYAIKLAEENVAYNQGDSLSQMMLSQILNVASALTYQNQEKFDFYSKRALETVDASINASPQRIPIYYHKAQVYITMGDQEKAIETLKYAESLNEKYYDSFCHTAKTYYFYGNKDAGKEHLDKCIDLGGISILAQEKKTFDYALSYYKEKKDLARLEIIYKFITTKTENNDVVWIELAKIYRDLGKKEEAIKAAEKAIELNPANEKNAQDFINKLK